MKIAILTLPLHSNYGGILQAYALQTVLQRMGHEVDVLDKRWKPFPWKWYDRIVFNGKQIIKRMLKKRSWLDWRHPSCYSTITSQVKPFVDKYIHIRSINTWADINEGDYDAIIVGSDQIWRPQYVSFSMNSSIEDVFLKFAKDWQIRRIAYAPSFGVDYWEYTKEETDSCQQLLHAFDVVSCREKSGAEMCTQFLKRDAKQVLDPTMLLSVDEYNRLCAGEPKQNNIILSFVLDDNAICRRVADAVARRLNKKIVYANSQVDNPYAPLSDRIQKPVSYWLSCFRDADLVITDSFHACVFAIIYNKPFLVIGNEKRGVGRIFSLLQQFGMTERYITDTICIEEMNLCVECPNVDFAAWQKESLMFLQGALL